MGIVKALRVFWRDGKYLGSVPISLEVIHFAGKRDRIFLRG